MSWTTIGKAMTSLPSMSCHSNSEKSSWNYILYTTVFFAWKCMEISSKSSFLLKRVPRSMGFIQKTFQKHAGEAFSTKISRNPLTWGRSEVQLLARFLLLTVESFSESWDCNGRLHPIIMASTMINGLVRFPLFSRTPVIFTSFFPVTFWSPKWRSRFHPWKGHE